jgi:heterotetrameric sarcosine oxidase gamma subunit
VGAALRFEDLSSRRRFGCKGPGAERWLAAAGFHLPKEANSAAVDARGVLAMRLATSEFLIEGLNEESDEIESMRQQLSSSSRPTDVYPVERQDLVIGIRGPQIQILLRQICSVDFAPLFAISSPESGAVVLTSMMGVAVVAWPRRTPDGPALTLWIDPSFTHYLWTTLLEVGRDAGDIAIGTNI